MIDLLSVLMGYFLGSVPSAYLVGRLNGIDLNSVESDGALGTSLSFHKLGLAAGIAVALLDFSKGIAAILLPMALGAAFPAVLLAGLAAVCGHNWSALQSFKGGRGTMAAYGVLAALSQWEFLVAMAVTGVFYFLTRRPTLSTVFFLISMSVVLWLQWRYSLLGSTTRSDQDSILLSLFPLSILIPKFIKYLQIDCRRDCSRPLYRPRRSFSEGGHRR